MSKIEQTYLPKRRSWKITSEVVKALAEAAVDKKPVSGWTHNFYRYPARFSPRFAATAIKCFSRPAEIVLDPYMGGGTSIVEGIAAGRFVVGNDLNTLAAFITKVKITVVGAREITAIRRWAASEVPEFKYHHSSDDISEFIDSNKTKNLSLVKARFIKKAVVAALASIDELPTENARNFTKCAVLRVGQWALDGRERHTSLSDFRHKLAAVTEEMLESILCFEKHLKRNKTSATLLNMDASLLDQAPIFQTGSRPSLVVTSPPYPGVHVLYHRWQVDGRRETPAPYWIAGCNDGRGAAFYNFGDRRETAADTYFKKSLATLQAIRRVIRDGGYMVQMLAFNRPEDQLVRYLENMETAGFAEVQVGGSARIWRQVPHRKWHTALLGATPSSNEVVLVHRAV